MKNVLNIIYIPGLSDKKSSGYYFLARYCNKHGIFLSTFNPKWKSAESFDEKLERIKTIIDKLSANNSRVALIGVSAGGSLALNAFYERPRVAVGIINVCGRLRTGTNVRPSLEWASRKSPSFKESVITCEKHLSKMDKNQLSRILTIYGLFDETVPTQTSKLSGAKNLRVNCAVHVPNIFFALITKTNKIFKFLTN